LQAPVRLSSSAPLCAGRPLFLPFLALSLLPLLDFSCYASYWPGERFSEPVTAQAVPRYQAGILLTKQKPGHESSDVLVHQDLHLQTPLLCHLRLQLGLAFVLSFCPPLVSMLLTETQYHPSCVSQACLDDDSGSPDAAMLSYPLLETPFDARFAAN
jgi:hypothetical protein